MQCSAEIIIPDFMNGSEFCKRFQLASCFCRDFTNRHISEELPAALRYNFALSERKNGDDQKIFLSGNYYDKNELIHLSPKEAIKIIFREGFYPVWIDLYVGSFNQDFTNIEVTFSQDFTDCDEHLYHQKEGFPPFHVVGPTAPEKWRSLEEDGAFPFIQFT